MKLSVSEVFSRVAHWTAQQCGRAYVFAAAVIIIIVWGATGPVFDYSDTWQLIINTGTTIVTFLMVFLIQNTQNRDSAAVQLKLDELIRANEKARNHMLRLEDLTDEELAKLKATFVALAGPAGSAIEQVREVKEDLGETEEALEQVSSKLSAAARATR